MRIRRYKAEKDLIRENLQTVNKVCPNITDSQLHILRELSQSLQISLAAGDLLMVHGSWYVTHSGLVRLARRRRCKSIITELSETASRPTENRWVFKATVFPSQTKTFVGYGDADPSNVSLLVRGAEMRVAETRAVNRALRKAYGIGICSVEEIGSRSDPPDKTESPVKVPPRSSNENGSRSVRDRLCQLIRQHELDANLVKAYAMDFCSVKALRDATREQVQQFVLELAQLGRERPQCPALPTQQLSRPERRCRMKRQITGLHAADRCAADQVPDGVFLVRVQRVVYPAGHKTVLHSWHGHS